MNNMPKKLREKLASDLFYRQCARQEALRDHECAPDPLTGKLIEWEHALIYAGKQIQKEYAIVPLCWYVHRGPGFEKDVNVWIALSRATEQDILEISHKGGMDYFLRLDNLNKLYGMYHLRMNEEIAYPWQTNRYSIV